MALRTSMLSVATSWWRVDTCVLIAWLSSFSADVGTITGFSSLGSSQSSSSETHSVIILLLLLVLTGLLLRLDVRDFDVFSLRAMRVCRLWKSKKEDFNYLNVWEMNDCNKLLDELCVPGGTRCWNAMDGWAGNAGMTWGWIIANSLLCLVLVILWNRRQRQAMSVILWLRFRLISLSQIVRQVMLYVIRKFLLVLRI